MKTVIFNEVGSSKVLQIEDREKPEPGQGEVRLKITAIGLNRGDCLFREGYYFFKPTFPSRFGYEGAGIVDAVGENVTSCKVGDRMAVVPSSFNASEQGCCAEYAVFPEPWLIPTPPSISNDIAGGIWMQYITAWGALVTEANIQERDCVVIPAASSSVGIAAIQITNMRKGVSIATTTSPDKVERLKELGAAYVINMKEEDYVARVKEISKGIGAKVVFDPVAGPTMHDHVAASALYGTIFIYGLLDRRPMDIHAGAMMKKLLTIKGYTLYTLFQDQKVLRSIVSGITEGIEQGALKPTIAKQFKLEQIRDACDYMESNQQIGKIIINP